MDYCISLPALPPPPLLLLLPAADTVLKRCRRTAYAAGADADADADAVNVIACLERAVCVASGQRFSG